MVIRSEVAKSHSCPLLPSVCFFSLLSLLFFPSLRVLRADTYEKAARCPLNKSPLLILFPLRLPSSPRSLTRFNTFWNFQCEEGTTTGKTSTSLRLSSSILFLLLVIPSEPKSVNTVDCPNGRMTSTCSSNHDQLNQRD